MIGLIIDVARAVADITAARARFPHHSRSCSRSSLPFLPTSCTRDRPHIIAARYRSDLLPSVTHRRRPHIAARHRRI